MESRVNYISSAAEIIVVFVSTIEMKKDAIESTKCLKSSNLK